VSATISYTILHQRTGQTTQRPLAATKDILHGAQVIPGNILPQHIGC